MKKSDQVCIFAQLKLKVQFQKKTFQVWLSQQLIDEENKQDDICRIIYLIY